MEKYRELLSANLRRFREELGMSQEKLSRKCGFSSTYVGKIERGNVSPSFHTLCEISDALDVPLRALFRSGDAPDWKEDGIYREVFSLIRHPACLLTADGSILKANDFFRKHFAGVMGEAGDEQIESRVTSGSNQSAYEAFRRKMLELQNENITSKTFELDGRSDPFYVVLNRLEEADAELFLFEIVPERVYEETEDDQRNDFDRAGQ